MMVRCYWCISILIIIPTIRCCSLTGPFCGWSAVVFSDRRYPSFWNFDSAISIDVIRMKSYMDSLFDPTCVPVRVTINKLNFFPNRKMSRFVSVFRNCGGLLVGVSEVLRRGAISEYQATFERHNYNAPVVPQSLSKNANLCYARSPAVP